MNAPVGSVRAAWLLTRLLLVRVKNLALSGFARAKSSVTRSATPSKSGTSWVLLAVCLVLWVPGLVGAMMDVVINLRRGVATQPALAQVAEEPLPADVTAAQDPRGEFRALVAEIAADRLAARNRRRVWMPPEPGFTEAAPMENALSLVVLCALAVSLHGLLMAPDLWRLEWSFEWLFTLPLSVPSLLAVRTVASTLANMGGYFVLGPLLGVIAYQAGWGYASPLVAVVLATPLLVLISLARQVFEVWLRLALEPARLRNLQAVVTTGGFLLWMPAMFVISPSAQNPEHRAFELLRQVPDWVRWLPSGLAVTALTATSLRVAALGALALVGEVGLAMAGAFAFLNRRLARGLIEGGARESARSEGALAPALPRRFVTAFQGKTLTLLKRDRNLVVTAFGLPAFVIAQQYLMFGDVTFLSSPARACAAAFAVGAMALGMALPQVLLKEAETFWFLKTFPRSIESLLLESAVLWGVLMTVYPVIGMVLSLRHIPAPPLTWALYFGLMLAGMAAYTVTATGLALLSSNPTATDTRKQLSPWGMWLYMVLVGVYIQALVTGDPWRILGGFVLAVMLAYAFWQKIGDHLPYMLDPSAAPAPRVSLADGLIAAEIFFVLQAVAMVTMQVGAPTLRQLLPSFTAAGAATCALAVLSVWQLKMTGLPRLVGPGAARAAGEALCGGALAAALGLVWLQVLPVLPFTVPVDPPLSPDEVPLLAVLGVFAAPVFEEIIFRGLVYTGLRRSLDRNRAVVAGSLLFAVLHPAHAFVPVFLMAIIGTLLFERSGLLVSSMIVHAVYNAAVLFLR